MPVVLDDAAAVAGFISLSIQLVSACIRGFALISEAKCFNHDTFIVRCVIEVEQYRLSSWATEAGLLQDPPRLKVNIDDIGLACSVLRGISALITNLEKLKEDYGFDLQETGEQITELGSSDSIFRQLDQRRRRRLYSDVTKIFRKSTGAWRKLKWVSVDAQRAPKLLQQLSYFNGQLERVLQRVEQDKLTEALQTLLRAVVVNTSSERELTAVVEMSQYNSASDEPVAATARLKQKGLTSGLYDILFTSNAPNAISESSDSSGSPRRPELTLRSSTSRHRSLKLTTSLLARGGTANTSIARQLAHYDGIPVLVEWKNVDKDYSDWLSFRVEGLSALLNELVDPSFHSLRCQGYVKDQISNRYGYVFELPANISSPRSDRTRKERALPSMWILRSLLSQSAAPSLNVRLFLAITLVETILQLHTAGWLHKGVRSDNILFFNNTYDHWMSDDFLPALYLAGYVYARADNPSELTEAPASQYESDLYRHPRSIGPTRASFCKAFDLYGLGCVLLELGLWSPMSTILSEAERRVPRRSANATPSTSTTDISGPIFGPASHKRHSSEDADVLRNRQKLLRSSGPASIRHLLEARAGAVYTEVVMACLFAEVNVDPEVDEPESSLGIQERSLAQLKAISV